MSYVRSRASSPAKRKGAGEHRREKLIKLLGAKCPKLWLDLIYALN